MSEFTPEERAELERIKEKVGKDKAAKARDINGGDQREEAKKELKPPAAPRIRLIPFNEIKLSRKRPCLVKGLIPRVGLCVAWGPPKCGKVFRFLILFYMSGLVGNIADADTTRRGCLLLFRGTIGN